MSLDPERLQAALSALAGSVLFGLFTFQGLLLAGQTPTAIDIARAGLTTFCAMVAGVLVGFFLAPGLMAMLPWPPLREVHAVGFLIGAFAWILTPFAYKAVQAWGAKKAGEVGQ